MTAFILFPFLLQSIFKCEMTYRCHKKTSFSSHIMVGKIREEMRILLQQVRQEPLLWDAIPFHDGVSVLCTIKSHPDGQRVFQTL